MVSRLLEARRSLVSNTLFSAITSGITFLSQSVFFVVLGRVLAVDEFGTLGLAMTTAGLISLIPSYGFDLLVIREIAQESYEKDVVVTNVLISKTLLSVIAILVLCCYVRWSNVPLGAPLVFLMFGIADICWSFTRFLNSVLKADENFSTETLVVTVQSVTQLLLTVFCYLVFGVSVVQIAFLTLASRLLGLLVSIFSLMDCGNMWSGSVRRFVPDMSLVWHFTRLASPFALQAILGNLYFQVDTVLLAELLDTTHVGYYQAAMRLVTAFMRIPGILMSAFYPRLARSLTEQVDGQSSLSVGRTMIHLLFVAGTGLTATFSLGSRAIITGLYGSRMELAVPIMFILSFVFVVRFVASGYGLVLISCHYQWVQLVGATVALIVNIALNLALVPRYGVVAAAFSSLVTNMVILFLYGVFVRRIFGSNLLSNITSTVVEVMGRGLRIVGRLWK